MSLHDKNLMFFDMKNVPADASASVDSKIVDLRYNGDDVDHRLSVVARLGRELEDAGRVTFTLQTSYDGSAWVVLVSAENRAGETDLYKGPLPAGVRRYLRCRVEVGSSGLEAANKVFAELTDAVDQDIDHSLVQKWNGIPSGGSVPEGPEDLASSGDVVTGSAT